VVVATAQSPDPVCAMSETHLEDQVGKRHVCFSRGRPVGLRCSVPHTARGSRVDQLYGRTCGNGLPQLLDVVGFADKWRRQIDSGSVSAMGVRGQDIGNAAQNEPV